MGVIRNLRRPLGNPRATRHCDTAQTWRIGTFVMAGRFNVEPFRQREPHMHTDVRIVGAGPTGLMLANQLARRAIVLR